MRIPNEQLAAEVVRYTRMTVVDSNRLPYPVDAQRAESDDLSGTHRRPICFKSIVLSDIIRTDR